MASNVCDIEKLVELFRVSTDENDENNSSENRQIDDSTGFELNENTKSQNTKASPYAKIIPSKRKEVLDPETSDNDGLYFDETSQDSGKDNWKKTPKWDISYRQSVTTSDVFLGMSFKNPSTSSCENMVVTIDLPKENRQNIDLKIEKDKLELTSPQFYLDLKLPHPVDPKRGNAQFDRDEEKLIITLIMDRELDLLNF